VAFDAGAATLLPAYFLSIAASSSAPSSMTTTEIQSQVMKPTTVPNEPYNLS
jgi:hypothetical protein